jgi:hypothetical protein
VAIVEAVDSSYAQIRIPLDRADIGTRVYWAKVDLADYDTVAAHTWHATTDGHRVYPHTVIRAPGVKRRSISMAKLLLGEPEDRQRIDYRNRNGMDCRRANLRYVTQEFLLAKRKPLTTGTSRFKGVTWDEANGKWLAAFRGIKLGRFHDENDAARAFDDAAWDQYGPDAYLNFPRHPEGVAMTGARARLLMFAVGQCLATVDIAGDPAAAAILRKARATVEHWIPQSRTWVSTPRVRLREMDVSPTQAATMALAQLQDQEREWRLRVGDDAFDAAVAHWKEKLAQGT